MPPSSVVALCLLLAGASAAQADTKFIAIYDATINGQVHRIIEREPYDSRAACNLSAEVAVDRHRALPWNVKAERIDITCEKLEWPEL